MEKLNLGNKSYSTAKGTYNAMWLHSDGKPAFWGYYNPFDGSYYLATAEGTIASGMWLEDGDCNCIFQSQGCYYYEDIRKAIQLGIF